MDCVLIQNEKAHQIWRNATKASLHGTVTSELLNTIVETAGPVQEGDLWDGRAFVSPPPPLPPPDPHVTRMMTAMLWAILKQMYPVDTDAQTRTKCSGALTRIIDAYKAQPWK